MYFSVQHLHISFGGVTAVNDLSFEVNQGEIFSIIGPNGAGKTTAYNLITGFLKADRGRIEFKGRDLIGLPPNRIARLGLTRTFQKTNVYPNVTVLDAVLMGSHKQIKVSLMDILFSTRRFKETEERVRVNGLRILSFLGLEHRADTLAKNLSYGEQRRLEIAIALALEPELLLLDEPAAGMNPNEANAVMSVIAQIRDRGITVILVEHNMDVVMNISDRVAVLDYGRKICEGPPAFVQDDQCVLEAYLGKGFADAQL
jgi:branched-chain amino acid transport system ATP-binding protein